MSIGTPNGILDITGATLRVSKMEFRQSTGFDTVLNNVARNTMLLMDETEQTTSNSWALKLPNAWVAEFHGYWASGSSGAPILFNFYNDSTSGTNGYTLSMNDTTISINYDGGSTLGSATLSSTLNNDTYRKVAVIFERSVLDVSVDGEHVFHFADSQLRDRVYDNNSGYVTFTHSSTDERKLKNLKFTNGDKWIREIDSSNIAYVGGNVGIGTTIPGTKLDVSGTVRGTHLIGDGSAISAIQSSNVSDFGSNVTRIGTLETDLGDNSSRITNLSSNLSDNSSRITALESGDISISGDKTFTGDIIFESNIHMNGGNVLVANTVNMTVSDPIIELGLNNIGTNDLGIIMTRPAANSNVAFVYDESDDILRMGYTLNGASDSVVDLDSNALAVSVQGDLEVGTANLFVDTSTSRVGIGTDSPAYTLDVHGSSNVGALTTTSVSGDGSGLTSLNASNLASGTVPSARLSLAASDIPNLDATKITSGTLTRPISTTTGTFSGNVGIGTASPSYTLDVGGDVNLSTGSTLRINGTPAVFSNWTVNGSDIYRSSGNVGIGVAPSHKLDVDGDLNLSTGSTLRINGTPAVFSNWTVSGSDIYRSSGNVGIGTVNPGTNLHLLGVGTGSGPRLRFETLNNGNGDYTVNGTEIGGIQFGADDLTWVTQHMTSEIVGIHKNPNYSGAQGDLAFKTSGTQGNAPTEKMRIRYDGNVGIGTANPEARLELGHYGTALSTDFGAIRITNHATNLHSTSLARFDISLGDISNNTGSGKRKLIFNSKTATSDSTGTDILCLDGEGGNVGIGTTSPTAKLDVEYNQGTLSSYNYSTTSTWHGKGLCLNGGSNSGGFLYGYDINHSIFLRQSPFSTNDHNAYCNVGYHAFYTGGYIQNQTEKLRITSDGKVGIGTTSPGAKLDVNGDINSDGLLKIYGLNTRRLLIGYQRYESTTRAMYPHSTSSWQNSWNVTYTRKRAGSKIYIVSDLCLAQAMGSTNSVSYRGILGRAKVNDGVTDRYSDTVTDWQRIDNSFHEYQRQSRIHFGPDNLPGGNTITITMQVSHGGGSGSRSNWGINVWGGRSYIEVFESMEL